MRLRNSVSSASETLTRKGQIAFLSVACSCCGAGDAMAATVLRFRREARLGVISLWSAVFIFVFVCCYVHADTDNSENSTWNGQQKFEDFYGTWEKRGKA